MERKEFLKKGLKSLGMLAVVPATIIACTKSEASEPIPDTTKPGGTTGTTDPIKENASTNGSSATDCDLTKAETAGPFPTKDPKSLTSQDITGGRPGDSMIITLSIKNKNKACEPLAEAIVDIWYCDADGTYSEYGGTGDNDKLHYLRGRQVTNGNGNVSYKAIFPGWYKGRAPHIHVQIFNKAGKSLLTTQIAFPKDVCDKVYTENKGVYKNGLQDTTNAKDTIFNDGYDDQIAKVTGTKNEGYKLSHSIVVGE